MAHTCIVNGEEKLSKLPIPLGTSSPSQRTTEPRPYSNMRKNLVKIARAVPEISSQTDTQTDRHTHTDVLITILRNRSRGQSKNDQTLLLNKMLTKYTVLYGQRCDIHYRKQQNTHHLCKEKYISTDDL